MGGSGFTVALKTPDNTCCFRHTRGAADYPARIRRIAWAACRTAFSSWKDHDDFTTGYLADPRSFCIQKALQNIAHGEPVSTESDVRGPRRLPVQERPVLFERLRADGQASSWSIS
jgi:hypothetical protein